MISTIIFTQENDHSSHTVVKWMHTLKAPCSVINEHDKFNIHISIQEDIVNINGKVNFHDIVSLWFRRGTPKLVINLPILEDHLINKTVENNLINEIYIIEDYLSYKLLKLPHIGNPFRMSLNKLIILEQAKNFGLNIPDSFVTTKRSFISSILHEKLITKSSHESIVINHSSRNYISYTELLDSTELLPETFFPSLVQKQIEKRADIRTFFLRGKFYSMAIYSQTLPQTSVDFRKYSYSKPNRNVPFDLPKSITDKLSLLIEDTKLNCCSLDLIWATDGKFYFLEINPVGQFGMVSLPCNYNLHKIIATELASSHAK